MNTPEKLRELRERAGLSMDALARRMGYRGASSIQKYEDPGYPAWQKTAHIKPGLARKYIQALEGRGDPPITREEILVLAGVRDLAMDREIVAVAIAATFAEVRESGADNLTPEEFASVCLDVYSALMPFSEKDNIEDIAPPLAKFATQHRG